MHGHLCTFMQLISAGFYSKRRKLLSDVTSQPDSEATSDAATEHLPSSSVDSHKLPDSSLAIIRPYTKRRNFKKVFHNYQTEIIL